MRGMDQILSEAGVPHVVQGFPAAFYVDFNDFAPSLFAGHRESRPPQLP